LKILFRFLCDQQVNLVAAADADAAAAALPVPSFFILENVFFGLGLLLLMGPRHIRFCRRVPLGEKSSRKVQSENFVNISPKKSFLRECSRD
jgi:hypothetical protein